MNPYQSLKSCAFWKPAVADINAFAIKDLWNPKFCIEPELKVSTFGSCFAQHISKALRHRGFHWFNAEPAPFGLSPENCFKFNYNVFSARTGNIYTTSLLKQWVGWALDPSKVSDEVWLAEDRYFDPFRPAIEPDGFETEQELLTSRLEAVNTFRKCITTTDYFFFTLGLTEGWVNSKYNHIYPMCPGTVAGTYDADVHQFVNQDFLSAYENLKSAFDQITEVNPKVKFLVTVSPVPLTATMSGRHVLTATTASKAILRSVADQITGSCNHIDYFPSYEIIASPPFKGTFYDPNQRTVSACGVNFVMEHFFRCQHTKFGNVPATTGHDETTNMNQHCEDAFLEAFGGQS